MAMASTMSFWSLSRSSWMMPLVFNSSVMLATPLATTEKRTQWDGNPAATCVVATVVPEISSGTHATVLLLTKFRKVAS